MINPFKAGQDLINRVRNGAEKAVDKVQDTVSNVVDTTRDKVAEGGRKLDQFVDKFEDKVVDKANGAREFFGFGNQPDRKYDGHFVGAHGQTFPPNTPLSAVPGVTPKNNPNPSSTVIYVNGISNDKGDQARSLQELADVTGSKAVGIHNATEGQGADVIQSIKDKIDKGKNPAVDTLADTVYAELKAGRDVHLMAHSQGALITSRALKDVAHRLRMEDGMSQPDVEKLMSKLNVETFGGAAASYPDGPKYVHYVNDADVVPRAFGLGDGKGANEFLHNPGKGAVVHHFREGSGIQGTHGLADVYLKERVPFDQARAGHFN